MTRTICVVGLGYVGLPTASMLAARGYHVYGLDVSPDVVRELQAGRTRISEKDLDTLVHAAVQSGNLRCGTAPEAADIFVIAVPTPVREDRTADLEAVSAAARSIATVLKHGDLVILESTVPPGTTTGVLRDLLERSGLHAGVDFLLAHCPERVLPGNLLVELVTNDRIIGGLDDRSAAAASELYASFVTGELLKTDATTAELVKLMENTHRDVNIALANEFALLAERLGIDVWHALKLASRHPRVQFLRPGPGVGGHCIAVDPWFVVQTAPQVARLIALARDVNDSMPSHVIDLVREAVGRLEGTTILALGRTYKADVADTRESPALRVIDGLRRAGSEVREHDAVLNGAESVEELAKGVDAIVLLVDHAAYRGLDPLRLKGVVRRPVVVDTRGTLVRAAWTTAGFRLVVLGDGTAS